MASVPIELVLEAGPIFAGLSRGVVEACGLDLEVGK